jgi:hypothetical protein
MVGRATILLAVAATCCFAARAGATAVLIKKMLAIGAAILLPAEISVSAELSRSTEYELKAGISLQFHQIHRMAAGQIGQERLSFDHRHTGQGSLRCAPDKVVEGYASY